MNPHIPAEWRKPKEKRNPDGSLNLIDPGALDVAQMAQDLQQGYFSYLAATTIAADPRSRALMPPVERGRFVSEGVVPGNVGSSHSYHFEHYLAAIRTDPAVQDQFRKVWLMGAISTLGDALAKQNYFNHQPELELFYHVRNGIAHGNRFHLTKPGLQRLDKYPAHNAVAIVRILTARPFVIDRTLNGTTIMFDFMEEGDILNLIGAVRAYCNELAYGTVGYRDA